MEPISLKNIVFLSLGSNLGIRSFNLKNAISEIELNLMKICAISNIYESESWAYEDRNYLNLCMKAETNLNPFELLEQINKIEKKLGRTKKTQIDKNMNPIYHSRPIDIDILLYNQDIIKSKKLTIPHPKLHLRMFVLKPLDEIASKIIHPVFKEPIHDIYKKCSDTTFVQLHND